MYAGKTRGKLKDQLKKLCPGNLYKLVNIAKGAAIKNVIKPTRIVNKSVFFKSCNTNSDVRKVFDIS